MLIIFDLDDTLIDTSGCITPLKLKLALQRLGEVEEPETSFQELSALNEHSMRTPDAIERYGLKKQRTSEEIASAIASLYDPLPESFSISCTPFAKEILEHFRALCPIALVTGGDPRFQMEKLKKAGIEPSIFSKIAIPEDSLKEPFYREIAKEFLATPSEVWVCGDRVAMDLAPARNLQFHTVHMRWGRGKRQPVETWIEHTISNLGELRNIIR